MMAPPVMVVVVVPVPVHVAMVPVTVTPVMVVLDGLHEVHGRRPGRGRDGCGGCRRRDAEADDRGRER